MHIHRSPLIPSHISTDKSTLKISILKTGFIVRNENTPEHEFPLCETCPSGRILDSKFYTLKLIYFFPSQNTTTTGFRRLRYSITLRVNIACPHTQTSARRAAISGLALIAHLRTVNSTSSLRLFRDPQPSLSPHTSLCGESTCSGTS